MAGLVDKTGLVDEMKPTSNLCGPKDSLSHIHDKSRATSAAPSDSKYVGVET